MKHSNNLLSYFLYIALIGIGIVIGIAVRHYYNLPLSETFNIIDLITLVVTAFLAVYIPQVLNRKMQINRDKKDVIENRIIDLQNLYRRINILVQNDDDISPKDLSVIQNTLDISRNKLDTLTTLITFSGFPDFSKEIKKIQTLHEEHCKLLITENININFQYSGIIRKKEEELFNQLDEATSLLIFRISES